MIKRILKVLAWISGLFILLLLATITTVDRTDFRSEEYFLNTIDQIKNLSLEKSRTDFWLAGWSTKNITPDRPVNLVGYKPRGTYDFIQDSSFVKTLVIGNGTHTIAILNYELLIIHPYLAKHIEEAVNQAGLPIDHIVFTATHTHSGLGGYIPGIMGMVAFGGYEEEVVQLFTDKTIKGIQDALTTMDTSSISYQKISAPGGVANRLIEDGPIDPFIRRIILEKQDGCKAIFYTYSAHATGLHSRYMGLSGDYPYYLNEYLEKSEYDFALFASGAMGSHRPILTGRDVKDIKAYSASLKNTLSNRQPTISEEKNIGILQYGLIPLSLPSPHFRISDNLRLRPWIFNWLFGDTNAHLDVVLLGNTLMVSSSGEVSGVFYQSWEEQAEENGLNLMITTFNGGYIGYVTPDEYYNLNHHEVRDTHWFGPHLGSYFKAVMDTLISQVNTKNN